MGINKQLVKEEKIKIKLADISFKVFNADSVVATTYHKDK